MAEDVSLLPTLTDYKPPKIVRRLFHGPAAAEHLWSQTLYVVLAQRAMCQRTQRHQDPYTRLPLVTVLAPKPDLVVEPILEETSQPRLDLLKAARIIGLWVVDVLSQLVDV